MIAKSKLFSPSTCAKYYINNGSNNHFYLDNRSNDGGRCGPKLCTQWQWRFPTIYGNTYKSGYQTAPEVYWLRSSKGEFLLTSSGKPEWRVINFQFRSRNIKLSFAALLFNNICLIRSESIDPIDWCNTPIGIRHMWI